MIRNSGQQGFCFDVLTVTTNNMVATFVQIFLPLFVLQENPDEVLKALNALGVDAYRGATQLNIIEPDNGNDHLKHLHTFVTRYPHQAKFLIDHVIYLPVNRTVPFVELDKICAAVDLALKDTRQSLVSVKSGQTKLTSKL